MARSDDKISMGFDERFKKKAIAYKEAGHTFKELKEVFGICSQTYYNWKKLLEETGSLTPRKVTERKRKIDKEKLRQAVEEKPDAYLYELGEMFDCTAQAIFSALRNMNITYKKKHLPIQKNQKKNVPNF